ncbi:flagellar export protein FliJ [Magnetovibrio sp.]|uniref:flagellar export protein FliJ n=1 Tax=Magnetovibrio sp. TaxID=2024836 RepID=UPI002F9574F7
MAANIKNLIRLHEWNVDEKRRKLGELLRLQGELEDQMKQLEADLIEQQKIAAADPTLAGSTYGAFAQQVIQRRENLQDSIDQMEFVIGHAQDELSDAYQELKKYETVESNRQRRYEREQSRREQIMLDEIALNQHRRKKSAHG